MILLPFNSHIALPVVLQQGREAINNKREFIMSTAVVCNSCLQPLVTALHILVVYVVDETSCQGQITVPPYA